MVFLRQSPKPNIVKMNDNFYPGGVVTCLWCNPYLTAGTGSMHHLTLERMTSLQVKGGRMNFWSFLYTDIEVLLKYKLFSSYQLKMTYCFFFNKQFFLHIHYYFV